MEWRIRATLAAEAEAMVAAVEAAEAAEAAAMRDAGEMHGGGREGA